MCSRSTTVPYGCVKGHFVQKLLSGYTRHADCWTTWLSVIIVCGWLLCTEALLHWAQRYDGGKRRRVCSVGAEPDAGKPGSESSSTAGAVQSVFRHVDRRRQRHSSVERLSILGKTTWTPPRMAYWSSLCVFFNVCQACCVFRFGLLHFVWVVDDAKCVLVTHACVCPLPHPHTTAWTQM